MCEECILLLLHRQVYLLRGRRLPGLLKGACLERALLAENTGGADSAPGLQPRA